MVSKIAKAGMLLCVLLGTPSLSVGNAPTPQKPGTVIARGTASIEQEKGLPDDQTKAIIQLEVFQNAERAIILAKSDRGSVVVSMNKLLGQAEYWHSGFNVINSKYVENGMSTEFHLLFPAYSVFEYNGMYKESGDVDVRQAGDGVEVVFGKSSVNNSMVTPQTRYHFAGNEITEHTVAIGFGNTPFRYLTRTNELFESGIPKKYQSVLHSITGDRRVIFKADVVIDSIERLSGKGNYRKFLSRVTKGLVKLAPGTTRNVANNMQLSDQTAQRTESSGLLSLKWAGLALLASVLTWIVFSKVRR